MQAGIMKYLLQAGIMKYLLAASKLICYDIHPWD